MPHLAYEKLCGFHVTWHELRRSDVDFTTHAMHWTGVALLISRQVPRIEQEQCEFHDRCHALNRRSVSFNSKHIWHFHFYCGQSWFHIFHCSCLLFSFYAPIIYCFAYSPVFWIFLLFPMNDLNGQEKKHWGIWKSVYQSCYMY